MFALDAFKNEVERVLEPMGLLLFDLEVSGSSSPIIRIFITRPNSSQIRGAESGVKLEDCIKVSRTLNDMPGIEETLPANSVLEVSSPGINRALKRPEHFKGALGERIKLTLHPSAGVKGGVLVGELLAADDRTLEIQDQELRESCHVAISDVAKARVDFKFG